MLIAPIWSACRGLSRAWDRAAAKPTLSGGLIQGAQRPWALRRWRTPGFGTAATEPQGGLDDQMLAGLDQLLSRSLGLRLAVVHRARDDRHAARSRRPRNDKFVGRRPRRAAAHGSCDQRHRKQGLSVAGSPGVWRMVAA